MVMHSATKYRHSDVIAGALIAKSAELGKNCISNNLQRCYFGSDGLLFALRGIKRCYERKTLRNVKSSCYLSQHPKVKTVCFPGLVTHPFHEIAKM
jgi:cystathionine beta-lyase